MTTQQQALAGVNSAFTPSNAAQATALAGVNAAFAPTQTADQPQSIPASSYSAPSTTKPVTSLSTQDGVTALNNAQNTYTKLSAPYQTPAQTPTTPTPTVTTTPKTATFINPTTEQTATIDPTDSASIDSLMRQGYQFSEGTYPTSLASTPQLAQANQQVTAAKATLDAATAKLTNFNVSNDPQLQSILSGITSQWNQRIQTLSQALNSETAGLTSTGIRTGAQYTGGTVGGVFGSIISAEETANANKISDLEAQKQQALVAAQQAFETQQWSRYNDLVTIANKAYNDQLSALSGLQKAQAAQDQKIQDATTMANRSNAVATLMSQGVTDPSSILQSLQKSGDTTVGAADVSTILKDLTPTTSTTDTLKFSQAQLGQLYAAGLTKTDIQTLSDHFNGNGDPSLLDGLTPDQQAAVHDVLNGTAAKKAASTVPTYAQLHPKAPSSKGYTSGSYTYNSQTISKTSAWLSTTKGTDGYVNPDAYMQAAQAWTASGGYIKDFIKNFPVSSWVNPANTYVGPQIDALVKQDAAAVKVTTPKGRTL